MSQQTISALFKDHGSAQVAIDKLTMNGYDRSDISLVVAENGFGKNTVKIEENSKGPEGAAIGATAGAIAGATLAGLTTVGAVVTTGGAALLAAGPVVAALAGAGVGGSAGGIIGGLIGLGMPETEAKFVDEYLGRGHVLVGVKVDKDNKVEVKQLLDSIHPEKITVH
jgi:hypothetical protein